MLQQQINEAVVQAVVALVASGEFRTYASAASERLVAELQHLLAVDGVLLTSSGTAALEIALRAAGVSADDEVLLAGYDYPGNFWAVERVGARPVLVDLEPQSWRMDLSQLEQAVTDNGSRIKAVVCSHLHGQLQDIHSARNLCERRGITLIEDACQAIGALANGGRAGTAAQVGIFSFGGGKVLSAGRGGALASADVALLQRARVAAGGGSGPYGLSEVQAAIVLAQLPWLEQVNQYCWQYFSELDEALESRATEAFVGSMRANLESRAIYQAGWLSSCQTNALTDESPETIRDNWVACLNQSGLPAGKGFAGFHRRSSRRCRRLSDLVHTADVAARTLTLPHRLALTETISSAQSAELFGQTLRHV